MIAKDAELIDEEKRKRAPVYKLQGVP